jgi:hypothetical protein
LLARLAAAEPLPDWSLEMTTLTPEDITRIVEIAVRSAVAAQRPTTQSAFEKGHLDERFFRRVEKFDGSGKSNWREFAFQFKVAVGMVNPRARRILEDIQKKGKDVDFTEVFNGDDETEDIPAEHLQKMGTELYAMLSSLVTGEAMTVVRGVMSGDGWMAWSKLNVRFDPRTPAKALISMLAVMSPKKLKEVSALASAIEDWEVKVKALGSEHDITMDDKILQAVLTSMCPEEVQNLIFQWADDKTSYKDIRDKVIALSQNRAAERRPKPMEVDQVKEYGWEQEWWDYKEDEAEWSEEGNEVKVDYVGETCLRCGGLGHYARECPTPKGKGKGGGKNGGYKGSKGYGKECGGFYSKGAGKDGYKGYKGFGKNGDKGKGKGFSGSCFVCGEVGHRAVNCPKKQGGTNMEIGAVGQDAAESTVVGGVWEIAAVESWKVVEKGGKIEKKYEDRVLSIARSNMFEGLEVGDGPEYDTDVVHDWPELKEAVNIKKVGKAKCMTKKVRFKEGVTEESGGCCEAAAICAVPFASCGVPPGLGDCTVAGIHAVEAGWRKIGADEITIDSAAEESVCPRHWATEFGTKGTDKKLKFVNASGGVMGHYGERVASFRTTGEAAVMSLTFQVSDVQKPLAAVRRIAEKGNTVQFGPRPEDNYIQNVSTGRRIMMIKKGGSYVVPAELIMKDLGFTGQAQ